MSQLYASKDVKIEFDNVSGVLTDVSAMVTKINGIEINTGTEDVTGFGLTWAEFLATGNNEIKPIQIDGFYDAASGGADEIFQNSNQVTGATRTFKITYGGSKTTQMETCIQMYKRGPEMKKFTKFTVTLLPSGQTTET